VAESTARRRALKSSEAARVLRISQTKLLNLEKSGTLTANRLPDSTHRRWPWEKVASLAEALYGEAPVHPDDEPPGS
jgi:hypothetical protein